MTRSFIALVGLAAVAIAAMGQNKVVATDSDPGPSSVSTRRMRGRRFSNEIRGIDSERVTPSISTSPFLPNLIRQSP